MPNYAPRVSLSFHDMSGVINMWASSCRQMVVYEHEADEEVKTTHVHMIMIDCKYKTQDSLCNQFRKLIEIDKKGNGLWSWEHKDYPNPDLSFIQYMSKGVLEPVFVKDVESREIEHWRSQWKHQKTDKKVIKESQVESHEIIEAKPKQMTKWELLTIMKHEYELYKQRHPDHFMTKTIRNRIVCQVLKDNKQVIGLYKAIDYSYALSLHYDTEMFLDAMDNGMKC